MGQYLGVVRPIQKHRNSLKVSKVKSKQCIAVSINLAFTATGNSHAIWDHSVTCHPAVVRIPPLPQPKQVLNLATPEGCKAGLTYVA